MPISATLTFASALTLTIQFLIFAYLYSSHRVRFFRYLLMAWGLMSLAAGLVFRLDYRIQRRDLLIGGLGVLIAASLGDLSDASVTARSSAGLATGGALLLASLQFWRRGAQPPRYRGTRFLAF